MGWLAWGLLFGLGVGGTMLLVRRYAWRVARVLGLVAVGLLALTAVGLAVASVQAFGRGGDSVPAGMAGFLILIFGSGGFGVLVLLIALVQAPRLGKNLAAVALALAIDPLLLVGGIWGHQATVVTPRRREITDSEISADRLYAAKMRALEEAVPVQYRNYRREDLDQYNTERARVEKNGSPVKPLVPTSVERDLRAWWAAQALPGPRHDGAASRETDEAALRFREGAAAGWLGAALLLPLMLPKPRNPR